MRNYTSILTIALGLMACHNNAAPTGPIMNPSPGPESGMTTGHGWTAGGGGKWAWNDEGGKPATTSLGAEPGGRGILVMNLPDGAVTGRISSGSVAYAGAGDATWSIYTETTDGEPSGPAVWTTDVTISETQISAGASKPTFMDLDLSNGPVVGSPFYLVFSTRSGHPTVAALAGEGNVRYQAAGEPSKAVAYKAQIRLGITDVVSAK